MNKTYGSEKIDTDFETSNEEVTPWLTEEKVNEIRKLCGMGEVGTCLDYPGGFSVPTEKGKYHR